MSAGGTARAATPSRGRTIITSGMASMSTSEPCLPKQAALLVTCSSLRSQTFATSPGTSTGCVHNRSSGWYPPRGQQSQGTLTRRTARGAADRAQSRRDSEAAAAAVSQADRRADGIKS